VTTRSTDDDCSADPPTWNPLAAADALRPWVSCSVSFSLSDSPPSSWPRYETTRALSR
jgi:hypothetical protein